MIATERPGLRPGQHTLVEQLAEELQAQGVAATDSARLAEAVVTSGLIVSAASHRTARRKLRETRRQRDRWRELLDRREGGNS